MSQNRSHAVMAQRHEGAESFDLFPTPAWGTRALCEYFHSLGYVLHNRAVWEPACGLGHMAKPLAEYFGSVHSSDVVDYGRGAVRDFLFPGDDPEYSWIITNPPFKLAEQFAITAIERATEGVAMLVRTAFLESSGRYRDLFSKFKPISVLQFVERLPMRKGRVDPDLSTATAYCWITWEGRAARDPRNQITIFDWLAPCRKRLERPGDYAEAA